MILGKEINKVCPNELLFKKYIKKYIDEVRSRKEIKKKFNDYLFINKNGKIYLE